jgi:stage III sporulation protein SpoIIIAA
VGGEDLCIDVLSGYPRGLGIEIATRALSAEVIVCDEIGDYVEAMALVSSHNCGVPLIASAHAGSVEELLRRTGIMLLHEADIFGAYVGIKRDGSGGFLYDVHYRDAKASRESEICL